MTRMRELRCLWASAFMGTSKWLNSRVRIVPPFVILWPAARNAIISSMATLRVRNIDETTMSKLRERAERHGRPLEDEVVDIIEAHLRYAMKTDPAFRRAVRKEAGMRRASRRRSG